MTWFKHNTQGRNYVITHKDGIFRSFSLMTKYMTVLDVDFDGNCLFYSNGEHSRPIRICKLQSAFYADYPEPLNELVFEDYKSEFVLYEIMVEWNHDPNVVFKLIGPDLAIMFHNRYLNTISIIANGETYSYADVTRAVVYGNQAIFLHSDYNFSIFTPDDGFKRYQYVCECAIRTPYITMKGEVKCLCHIIDCPQTKSYPVYLEIHHFVVYRCESDVYLVKNLITGRLKRFLNVVEFKDIIQIRGYYYMVAVGFDLMTGFEQNIKSAYSKGYGDKHLIRL
jgi:hypothetical protein